MNWLQDLRTKIENRTANIGVIGLGYVGLPVACKFAEAGFRVSGIDIVAERVAMINAGHCPIEGDEPGLAELVAEVVEGGRLQASTDYAALNTADIVLVNVETPVDENGVPRYIALQSACRSLGEVLSDGTLVIVESTLAPGTMEKIVRPILTEVSGKVLNANFFLGACPERVMPGKLLANIQTMSRVCGGSTAETAETMVALYRCIVEADLDPADLVTAEVVKTAENAYRDVQIAFANEVALICEAVGADVWRVRDLVNKSPSRDMHLPGAGVGGHCIPKDGLLLAHGAGGRVDAHILHAARRVNDHMPYHMADLLCDALNEVGISIDQAKVAILGYAYLENSDDTRNSPSAVLVSHLRSCGAEVVVHDPWVEAYKGDVFETVKGCDAAVVMVAHSEYKSLSLAGLKSTLGQFVLVDGRRVFDREAAVAKGLIYRGVGQILAP